MSTNLTTAENRKSEQEALSLEYVKKLLLDFYSEQENMNLIDYYSRTTFFDLIKKSRSETVHSAFLKWILDGSDFPNRGISSNIMHFLQLLVKRHEQQKNADFDDNLKEAICTGSLELSEIAIETEKPIQDFDSQVDSKDRLDIYIHCKTNINANQTLEIFIENKVGSKEGSPHNKNSENEYEKKCQTERYYYVCHDPDKIQLFVYLTAINKSKLDEFSNHIPNQWPIEFSRSQKFIQICYQDLLDRVLLPLRTVPYMPSRTSNLIEEYINCLGIPAINDSESGSKSIKQQIIMAIPETEREKLKKFFNNEKNKELLTITLDVVALNKIYLSTTDKRTDIVGAFREKFEELLKNPDKNQELMIESNGKSYDIIKKRKKRPRGGYNCDDFYICYNNLGQIKIRSKLKQHLEDNGQPIKEIPIEIQTLLEDFWQRNSALLLTALKVIADENTSDEWHENCYKKMTSRDLSKFTVGDEDGLGKTDVVERFCKHLLENDCEEQDKCTFINNYLSCVSDGRSHTSILLTEDDWKQIKAEDDQTRLDNPSKKDSIMRSDRFRRMDYKNDQVFYISTQWGGQYNSTLKTENFPKLWKKIKEYNTCEGRSHPFDITITK